MYRKKRQAQPKLSKLDGFKKLFKCEATIQRGIVSEPPSRPIPIVIDLTSENKKAPRKRTSNKNGINKASAVVVKPEIAGCSKHSQHERTSIPIAARSRAKPQSTESCPEEHSDPEYTDSETVIPTKILKLCTAERFGMSTSRYYHRCYDGIECAVWNWSYGDGPLLKRYGFPREYYQNRAKCNGAHLPPFKHRRSSIKYVWPADRIASIENDNKQ